MRRAPSSDAGEISAQRGVANGAQAPIWHAEAEKISTRRRGERGVTESAAG